MLVPFGAGQDGARRKYLDQAELITTTLLGVSGVGAVAWSGGFAVLRDGIMQSGLVCFDLSDQVNAICGRLLEGFFWQCMASTVTTASLKPSAPSMVCTAGISLDLSSHSR